MGHIDIVQRGLELFETIVIGVGLNNDKNYMFNLKQRKQFIQSIFKYNKQIMIRDYEGLTTDFCEKEKIRHIIRGVRGNNDFDYEQRIYFANSELNKNIETLFFPSKKEHIAISSSVVREIILNKGNLKHFLPKPIISKIYND